MKVTSRKENVTDKVKAYSEFWAWGVLFFWYQDVDIWNFILSNLIKWIEGNNFTVKFNFFMYWEIENLILFLCIGTFRI